MGNFLKPLLIALKGKGLATLFRRVWSIQQRYGPTIGRMEGALDRLVTMLQQYNCNATLPVTAAALGRNGARIQKYQTQGIEFAVHGYLHVDHSQLSFYEQMTHLAQAEKLFQAQGIHFEGFRAPYLRWNKATMQALALSNFKYDSSPSIYWPVDERFVTENYQIALDFYGARPAADYPALPTIDAETELLRIPYCLPDDEALIERLTWDSPVTMNQVWLHMFYQIHQAGELFNLGLHPERIKECAGALEPVLRAVQQAGNEVWTACLSEIAAWWQARLGSRFTLTQIANDRYEVIVDGPEGTTLLIKGLTTNTPTAPWRDGYHRLEGLSCQVKANCRPILGVSEASAPGLRSFLRQQGYLVEISEQANLYAIYLDRPRFSDQDERPLLSDLEARQTPLLRLARWPHSAFSAFCVTGDIDALTIWDYGLRFVGR